MPHADLRRARAFIELLESRQLLAVVAPVIYQAENASITGAVTVDKDHAGYTGTGFTNFPITNGTVTWSVNASTADAYRLTFRYALGITTARTAQLSVNGVNLTGGIKFNPTGSWTNWSTVSFVVQLKAGANAIQVKSIGQDTGNIDNLSVVPATSGNVSLSNIGVNGYNASDTNVCSIGINTLWTDTKTNLQFSAFYDTNLNIIVGRRVVGGSNWTTYNTGITVTTGEVNDDHNIIAIAVDSAGYLHMSWNMHNVSLNYAISSIPVTAAALPSLTMVKQTITNAPSLFPSNGLTTNSVTYPEFYVIPNSTNLLFTYRNGGPGGGSGNGDQYIDIYNPSTKQFTNTMIINGTKTSVNAYLNSLAYDSKGNLLMSWTWRDTPNWQTNSNIMFAQSPDNGKTWYKIGGTTQYTLPIIQNTSNGGTANQVGQVVWTIPQGSSFINQTSMTVDNNDRPVIATYYTPAYDPVSKTGNPNRQYMLIYFDGSSWKSSQISQRTTDNAIDGSGANVRDLGRPIVVVDKQNRVIVITRSEDVAMGAYKLQGTSNGIQAYYSNILNSPGSTWNSIGLDSTNMGNWEPSYDMNLWKSKKILSMLFEPTGRNGLTTSIMQTIDWNEAVLFA